MLAIKSILSSQPHHAFVQLWYRLRHDFPFFQNAEQQSIENDAEHDRCIRNTIDALYENQPLKTSNLDDTNPLALLVALDRYLHERYDTQGIAPPSRITVEKGVYLIHRRFFRRQTHHDRQTGHLHSWLHHHWIIPESIEGISIQYRRERLAAFPRQVLEDGCTIRVFAPGFADAVTPQWENGDPDGWLAHALSDRENRWQSIRATLEKAVKLGAQVVVLPELTVCPELRLRVSLWLNEHPDLPLYLILPGTFHQQFTDGTYNYGELYGPNGKKLLSHRKIIPFGPKNKPEKIKTGNRIELLDTPLGLLAMPICRDFCEEGSPFGYLWEYLGADWLLVPAFGDQSSLGAHMKRAALLHRAHGSVSVIANQNPDGRDADHGFVCHPDQCAPPSPCRKNSCIPVKFRI